MVRHTLWRHPTEGHLAQTPAEFLMTSSHGFHSTLFSEWYNDTVTKFLNEIKKTTILPLIPINHLHLYHFGSPTIATSMSPSGNGEGNDGPQQRGGATAPSQTAMGNQSQRRVSHEKRTHLMQAQVVQGFKRKKRSGGQLRLGPANACARST